jgi:hypothetical protein
VTAIFLLFPVIYRRFPAFALIFLQILNRPAPIYRELRGLEQLKCIIEMHETASRWRKPISCQSMTQ